MRIDGAWGVLWRKGVQRTGCLIDFWEKPAERVPLETVAYVPKQRLWA